jgi:phosphopantetheinyl transferase
MRSTGGIQRSVTDSIRVVVCREPRSERGVEHILAEELGVPASDVVLRRDKWRAPRLERPETDLCVSVSHSRDLTMVALARGFDVGIDVECLHRDTTRWVVWAHVLTPAELGLVPTSTAARNIYLLRLWVAKEAIVKAAGVGLAVDPREIELAPDGGVSEVPPSFGSHRDWSLSYLEADSFVAAVASRPGFRGRDPEARVASGEDAFGSSGGGGIRTHGALARPTAFKAAPFDRSGTPPARIVTYRWGTRTSVGAP